MINQIQKKIKESFPELELMISLDDRNIVSVKGECQNWQQLIDVGHFIAHLPQVENVISEMTVNGQGISRKDYSQGRIKGLAQGVIDQSDVVIVGAGVIGCGIARELAKYDFKTLVLEQNDDLCTGASKANNGNIHPGHAAKPGTLKARLNVEGNRMYDRWAEELGFVFQRNGLMYIAWEEEYISALEKRYETALANDVDGLRWIDGKEALAIEPELAKLDHEIIAGLWLPSLAHVEPYEVTVALAENAAENGVGFFLNTTVCDIQENKEGSFHVITSKGIIETKYIINCAGVYADDLSKMAGDHSFTIHPRKGSITILDKNKAYPYKPQLGFVSSALEKRMDRVKNSESKGGGCCKTPESNYLLGPSAREVQDREDTSTDLDGLSYSMSCNQHEGVGYQDIIRVFTGVRAADFKEDFIIKMSPVADGFINVAAIQSPGLASAPAIAKMVEEILIASMAEKQIAVRNRKNYQPNRQASVMFRDLSREEQGALIEKNPDYGRIVCRCETITEGEILDAIRSPIVPTSVEAIKRRTRAGMGRCQGGFCQARVLEILARELGKEWTDIQFSEKGTNILVKDNRKN